MSWKKSYSIFHRDNIFSAVVNFSDGFRGFFVNLGVLNKACFGVGQCPSPSCEDLVT